MNITTWFKIKILRKVVFVNGKPVDCHGLRFKNGLPFDEGTEYYIDKTAWQGWDYFGGGVYCTPKGFKCDLKNPYYLHKLNKTLTKFGKEVNNENTTYL